MNNAGISGANGTAEEITEAEWDLVMATNAKGTFLCTKHAVPLMRRLADGKEQPVPAAEYRALRWKVAELQPGKSFVVSARVRVAAGEAARNN